MTRQSDDAAAGRRLLRFVHLVFDDEAAERIFEPALADLQHAVAAAGTQPARRTWIWLREYAAFWKLVAVALARPGAGAGAPLAALLLGRRSAGSLLLLVPILYLAMARLFAGFVAGTIAGGVLISFAIASWNRRHPTVVARAHGDAASKSPEINISSVPVGGDIGGFFFVVASSAVSLLGVPGLRPFVIAAAVMGLLVAWARVVWMRGHPAPPVNHVVGR